MVTTTDEFVNKIESFCGKIHQDLEAWKKHKAEVHARIALLNRAEAELHPDIPALHAITKAYKSYYDYDVHVEHDSAVYDMPRKITWAMNMLSQTRTQVTDSILEMDGKLQSDNSP